MSRREYISSLLEELLADRRFWDKRDCLNSDGRRLLGVVIGQVLEVAPWLRGAVVRVRREPCWKELLRFREILCEHGIIECEG